MNRLQFYQRKLGKPPKNCTFKHKKCKPGGDMPSGLPCVDTSDKEEPLCSV